MLDTLARHLAVAGVKVVEVNRPEKLDRNLDGKDDFIDAEAATRAVLSGRASAIAFGEHVCHRVFATCDTRDPARSGPTVRR